MVDMDTCKPCSAFCEGRLELFCGAVSNQAVGGQGSLALYTTRKNAAAIWKTPLDGRERTQAGSLCSLFSGLSSGVEHRQSYRGAPAVTTRRRRKSTMGFQLCSVRIVERCFSDQFDDGGGFPTTRFLHPDRRCPGRQPEDDHDHEDEHD